MQKSSVIPVLVILAALSVLSAVHADDAFTFEPNIDFAQLPDNVTLGQCSAVAVSGKGEIFLFHRGKHPIICLGPDGKYIRSWGDDLIGSAHGMRIDKDENIWVTDVGNHQVFKFDPVGKLLLTLGTGKPGDGLDQFNRPTDIAFSDKGELYITDGYGNSRVMKFTPHGRLIGTWGEPGKNPGQFNLPHSIVIDADGRVLVGDRENNRIQIFDGEGKLLHIYRGFAPYGMAFSPTGELFVADGRANQVLRLDEKGKVAQRWGKLGTNPGQFQMPHMLDFDAAGNLFVAEVNGTRLQMLSKK